MGFPTIDKNGRPLAEIEKGSGSTLTQILFGSSKSEKKPMGDMEMELGR